MSANPEFFFKSKIHITLGDILDYEKDAVVNFRVLNNVAGKLWDTEDYQRFLDKGASVKLLHAAGPELAKELYIYKGMSPGRVRETGPYNMANYKSTLL